MNRNATSKPLREEDFLCRGQIYFIDMQSRPDPEGFKFILNYQDHSTEFVKLRPLRQKTVEEVAGHLLDIFLDMGCPTVVHSDTGLEFRNKLQEKLVELWPDSKFAHGKPRPFQPSKSVEWSNLDIERKLICWMSDHKSENWAQALPFIQFAKNRCYHHSIGMSPFQALWGERRPTNGVNSLALPSSVVSRLKTEEDLEALLVEGSEGKGDTVIEIEVTGETGSSEEVAGTSQQEAFGRRERVANHADVIRGLQTQVKKRQLGRAGMMVKRSDKRMKRAYGGTTVRVLVPRLDFNEKSTLESKNEGQVKILKRKTRNMKKQHPMVKKADGSKNEYPRQSPSNDVRSEEEINATLKNFPDDVTDKDGDVPSRVMVGPEETDIGKSSTAWAPNVTTLNSRQKVSDDVTYKKAINVISRWLLCDVTDENVNAYDRIVGPQEIDIGESSTQALNSVQNVFDDMMKEEDLNEILQNELNDGPYVPDRMMMMVRQETEIGESSTQAPKTFDPGQYVFDDMPLKEEDLNEILQIELNDYPHVSDRMMMVPEETEVGVSSTQAPNTPNPEPYIFCSEMIDALINEALKNFPHDDSDESDGNASIRIAKKPQETEVGEDSTSGFHYTNHPFASNLANSNGIVDLTSEECKVEPVEIVDLTADDDSTNPDSQGFADRSPAEPRSTYDGRGLIY